MRVKFSGKDPRAGQIIELPDAEAQRLIDAGTATKAADDAENPVDPKAATGGHGEQSTQTEARQGATVQRGEKTQTDETANKAAADTANKAAAKKA